MRTKLWVLVLVCLLVVPALAENNSNQVYEGVIEKPIETGELPEISLQVLKGEKPGVTITAAFALSDGVAEDFYDINMINYAATSNIYFFVCYTAMWNTNVKFHFIITGPQNYTYTTTDVYQARYNTRSYVYIYASKSTFLTRKGLYKLIVYADQMAPFGAGSIVGTSTFRVY